MPHQKGFTILEVLVGFLVAALLLSVILSAFASGVRGLVRADQYSQAALVAQSRMAELGVTLPLQEGRLEGRDNSGYAWSVAIAPLHWDFSQELQDQGRVLYRIDVKVNWQVAGRDRSFDLSSLRLAQ